MKNKLFLFIVLLVLFVFGILIYDFSDKMDSVLTDNKWYFNDNNDIYILSLKNNKFNLTNEEGEKVKEFRNCNSFQYNSNVSRLKLKCDGVIKKIYISSYDDNSLVLNENGEELSFYSSKELALIEHFKRVNELSNDEYENLLSINFNEDLFISYKEFIKLYKNKKSFYIGLVSNNINYENVYNYQVLNNLITNSTKKFYLINVDNLNEKELSKLKSLTNIDNYENKVYIYEVKNKTIKCKVIIDAISKNDLENYQNI